MDSVIHEQLAEEKRSHEAIDQMVENECMAWGARVRRILRYRAGDQIATKLHVNATVIDFIREWIKIIAVNEAKIKDTDKMLSIDIYSEDTVAKLLHGKKWLFRTPCRAEIENKTKSKVYVSRKYPFGLRYRWKSQIAVLVFHYQAYSATGAPQNVFDEEEEEVNE